MRKRERKKRTYFVKCKHFCPHRSDVNVFFFHFYRDLLNADPSTKPWLKFRSISRTDNLAKVREDASQAFPLDEGTFTATPAKVLASDDLSQSTSSEQSETLNDSYDY